MKTFIKAFSKMATWLSMISGIAIFVMASLICIHVILRGFFNSGVPGVYEMVQCGMLSVVALTLAENELTSGSIVVNFMLDMMKPRVANIFYICASILSTFGLAYVLYNQIGMISAKYANGATTAVLFVPHWVLVAIMCVGLFFFVISYIIKTYNLIDSRKHIVNRVLTKDEKAAETKITSEF